MAILDDVIGVFSPGWKAARLRSRAVIQAYEAVKTTRTHKARRENRTADQLSLYGAVSLREQARYLDNNHDLVIGVFDKLEERVVGKNGIIVEPHPVLRNGAIARDLAAEIRTRWSEWSVSPEVTGQFTRPMLERLMLRTWLRDGEVFAQMVSGRINSLTPSAGVHFWLEALEPDFIPMTSDESNRLNQGVFVDDWGRPEKYLVYKSRPVSGRQMETKEVDAERMLHLKFVRRLHQMRGTSLLSGVLIRLSALKEYEDSELTAARIAAALGMYIRKGDGQSYETDGNDSKENERELTIQPGIIYDDLKPGEEIGMVKSDRPNPNLETFRNGQLRAVAAGSRLSFSSTARNYNGTYSAQRQELVESTDGYLILQDWFIGAVTRPMYRAWLKQAVASGVIRLPRDLDRSSLYTAVYSGPVMPWIDPVKEAEAWKIQIRGGAATESDWVRAGGRNPDDVKRRRKAEIDENRKLDLVFDTDPASDKGGSSAQRNDRSRSTPTTSPKNNSWFRMQAGHQSDADIYIYDEIGFWGVTAKQFISDLNALGDITHINLHINSPGGDVFEGIAIFNALKTHGASITVYVDGVAASMASVIAMVGNPVIMPENTFMMIHKPFGFTGGDAEDMRTYADLLDKVEAVLLPAYAQKTGKTTDEIAAMLADETWMSGAECLAHGFADQVTPAVKAMACIQSKRTEEFKKMPESIRNMITPPRNSAPRVQDDEPAASRTPVQAAAPVVDENSIRAQVLAEQKARVNGINDLFAMFGGRYQTLQAQCLADPECSLEQAREKLLNEMGRESTPSNKNTPAHIYAGNGNFVGDGIRQALMARAGFEKTERDNVYNGMTLREYARMSLTERGIGVSGYNPMQMVGAAFTHSTSDFGNILLDVANKAILQGWEDAPETYEQWTRKGQLSDFKIAHRVGMGGFSALRQVREGAEYKYVTTGDKQATIALATYGELFSITRQAIINDDLNMLTDVPMKLGRAAKSTIADLVYAILTSNPKISTDNVSLFDKAKHANVLESAAMDVASLDKARQLMRVQKEGERHLNIRPAFVLVPTAMESVANQVIRSSSVKGADINAGIINPVKDFATVIAEPRLDDNSQTTFYLAASKGSDTIEVAYLNGVDTPYIDQMEGFSVDGVTTKVRIDAGVAPVDHRGLVKCTA
ncbi:phage portal protein [Escherichia coli]|nr:phage portal protein [Escherichia coli]EFU1033456.1 phage portal protein [Escherichia coli]